MAKTKISAKRASSFLKSRDKQKVASRRRLERNQPFNPKTFEGVRLKAGVELEEHDPEINLKDVKLVQRALLEALLDGDPEAFKEILRAHLETVNKDVLSDKSGVARTTLFRMLAPDSNPTLKNVAKVFRVLKAG